MTITLVNPYILSNVDFTEVFNSDFNPYSTGNFLPQTGWAANDWDDGAATPNTVWTIAGGVGARYMVGGGSGLTDASHIHYDTGTDYHEVEAEVRLVGMNSVGGVMLAGHSSVGVLIYLGFELVVQDGSVGGGSPENKYVVYYRNDATHDEFHEVTGAGLSSTGLYVLTLRHYFGGLVSAWLDGVQVLDDYALSAPQKSAIASHTRAGLIKYANSVQFERVSVRAINPILPDAPTSLTATAGSSQVSLSWTAPAFNGGSAITDYAVQWRTTSGPGAWNTFSDGTSTSTAAVVTGLTNGTSYDFQVAATTAAGTGPFSATDTETPAGGGGGTVTVTQRTAASGGTTQSASYTSPSFTPTANSKLYVWAVAENNNSSTAKSFSISNTGGLTFSAALTPANQAWDGDANYGTQAILYVADVGGSPSSMTVAVDAGGSNSHFYSIEIFDVISSATLTLVQSKATSESDTGGDSESISITMDSALTSGNRVVCLVAKTNDGSGAVSVPTGFSNTLINQSQTSTGVSAFHDTDISGTTVTISDLGQSVGASALAVLEFS